MKTRQLRLGRLLVVHVTIGNITIGPLVSLIQPQKLLKTICVPEQELISFAIFRLHLS